VIAGLRRGGEAREYEKFIDVTVPGDYLLIRLDIHDGGDGDRARIRDTVHDPKGHAYFIVKGKGKRGETLIYDEVEVAERCSRPERCV
jgi:hypothetical protein